MSREKEDLKRGMLNEQARGGKQASFSGVMGPHLSEVRDLEKGVVVDSFLKSSFTDIHSK